MEYQKLKSEPEKIYNLMESFQNGDIEFYNRMAEETKEKKIEEF